MNALLTLRVYHVMHRWSDVVPAIFLIGAGSRTVPFALGKKGRTVIIGANADCQIRLHYDAEWTERVVQN
jgi:hypothetical protein